MGSTNPPRKRNHPACDESDHPAAKKQIAGTSKDGKAQQANTARISSPKPPCQPLGNLLARENAYNARDAGLGRLAVLPDEILIGIVGELEALDLMRIQAVSHALFAFSRIEGQWKHLYVRKTAGKLERWQGTWRATYLRGFCNSPQTLASGLPTDHINISDIYSDALYLPYMAARYDANDIASSSKFANNVKRMDGSALSVDDLGDEPLILTNLMDQWAALQEPGRWSLSSLAKRFPSVVFRAEAVLTKLSDYIPYHNDCTHDESPLYIFDANFVEKTEASDPTNGLQQDFAVPHLFQDDLFSVLGEQRPNFRWLIAGPARSGSTFHCDPNATSAWNAVVTGRKLWILFPPDVTPPGVFVSSDQAEVEAPLSLAEWLFNYYHIAKRQHGAPGRQCEHKNHMLEGICNAGEVFYVPSGWWHLVVNLEDSIAVTQNFVSRSNLEKVLLFLRTRADQVSGFGHATQHDSEEQADESGGGQVSQLFERALQRSHPHLYAAVRQTELTRARTCVQQKQNNSQQSYNLWSQLHGEPGSACPPMGFAFDFEA